MQVNVCQSFFHQSFAAAFSSNFINPKVFYYAVYSIFLFVNMLKDFCKLF